MMAEYSDTRFSIFGLRLWFKGPHHFENYMNVRHCCRPGETIFCEQLDVFKDKDDTNSSCALFPSASCQSRRGAAATATPAPQLVVVARGGAKGADAYINPTEAAQRLFKAIDRDGNGSLTRAEVIRTIRDASRSNNQALLHEMRDLLGLPPSEVHQEDESHVIFERGTVGGWGKGSG